MKVILANHQFTIKADHQNLFQKIVEFQLKPVPYGHSLEKNITKLLMSQNPLKLKLFSTSYLKIGERSESMPWWGRRGIFTVQNVNI